MNPANSPRTQSDQSKRPAKVLVIIVAVLSSNRADFNLFVNRRILAIPLVGLLAVARYTLLCSARVVPCHVDSRRKRAPDAGAPHERFAVVERLLGIDAAHRVADVLYSAA